MTLELDVRAAARANRASGHIHVGIAGALRSAVVTMLADAQLARAARRYQSRGSPPVPAHLRRDLGLMPEVLEPRSHWDYR
ncbi:hypothetical protein PRN20_07415 [Devosia sp. ZB163]|uniref:hypothetical protein n=1 Tax=Devosia sp. ZB163 TaxID=3025938 RepID=UPI002362E4A9|nr:hypothetical protein [Devosia sp. ZB163]MDC9823556.1 hypothetical protein [Devosia sp. ZB163]